MDPRQLPIADYTYTLPDDRIAAYPQAARDESKLLVYENRVMSEDRYHNIASHLEAGSLMVFNDSRVIEARLLFYKESGARIEIFCLEPHEQYGGLAKGMGQTGSVLWLCMVGGASKWKHGVVLEKKMLVNGREIILQALYHERRANDTVIELTWNDCGMSFAELLQHAGDMPLPPYIKRKAEAGDQERYQTIYASEKGSVAAPTAGLHFTDRIFKTLTEKKISKTFVTLHVGAGTFKPVSAERMQDHDMHAELIDVTVSTLQAVITHLDKGITAVGTTSMRTLESLYWLGIQASDGTIDPDLPLVDQWDPYNNVTQPESAEALDSLLQWMQLNGKDRLVAKTRILIAPGYKPRIINALVTNFHQPGSTLLLLIASLVGDEWRSMYQYALDHEFRFLSYGDGCLIKLH